jgi:hypothetical protein
MDDKLRDAGLSPGARIVAAIAISSLVFLLTRQPWVDSATLNDPKAAPRAVSRAASFGLTKGQPLGSLNKHRQRSLPRSAFK